jgi:hypothetical protein
MREMKERESGFQILADPQALQSMIVKSMPTLSRRGLLERMIEMHDLIRKR